MTKVMSNPDLLTCIIDHLVDEHATSRGVLGQLALVNKQTWLKVCRHSVFKAPITTKRLPVTALDDGAMIKKQYQVPSLDQQCYAYIRDYGRSVLMSRQLSLYSNNNSSSKKSLEQRLRLGCEIWDSHDGMVFFSGSGPLKIIPYEKTVLLRLGGVERKEVLGPAFSALSRDPKNQRYHSMSDFFRHVHYMKSKRVGGGGSAVCIRVTVTCEETGRMSVLWDTDSEARLKITQPHASGRSYLPSGAFFARTEGWRPITPALLQGSDNPLEARIGFYVFPLPDQSEVPVIEKLWQLAGGDQEKYHEHASFVRLGLNTNDEGLVRRFLQSLVG